jgi:hypothetical protein
MGAGPRVKRCPGGRMSSGPGTPPTLATPNQLRICRVAIYLRGLLEGVVLLRHRELETVSACLPPDRVFVSP